MFSHNRLVNAAYSELFEVNPTIHKSNYSGKAQILANRVSKLSAQRAAQIVSRNCEIAQFVRAGETLFELDVKDLQLQVDEIQVKLDDLKQQLEFHKKRLNRRELNPKAYTQEAIESEELQVQRIQLQMMQTEKSRDLLKLHIDRSKIRSPFSGIIANYHAEVGDFVSPTQILATILEIDHWRILFQVPLEVAKSQQIGMKIPTGEFEGAQLTRIHPSINETTGSVVLEYSLKRQANSSLIHGQIVSISLEYLVSKVGIPLHYVQTSFGVTKIRVQRKTNFEIMSVQGEIRDSTFFPFDPQSILGLKLAPFSK